MKRYTLFLIMFTTIISALEIFPRQVVMNPGDKLQFCVFTKVNGAVSTPNNLQWYVQRGIISNKGEFTAPNTSGKYIITVTVNKQKCQAIVFVKNPRRQVIQSIQIISPKKKIYEKQALQLQAVAYDRKGNEVYFSPAWESSGAGSISTNGLFTATRSGEATVKVRDINSHTFTTLNLTVHANQIQKVTVSPKTTSLSLRGKIRFFALGYDSEGKEISFKPRWYVEGQGSVKQTGEFTAGSYRGNAKVWAKDPVSGKKGYANVSIHQNSGGNQGSIEIGTALIHNSYTLRIAYQVLGVNIHRTKLFAIQPNGSKQILAEQTCGNGKNIVFEKQFAYRTIAFEIQLFDNYNRVVASVRKNLDQIK
ncbi:hypothetical protein [Candidatus Uabimicrobium sp. HlEnr_7]|uniref:hypothetical protein n=1 Tax=Candidatus Uabimicrobium helgolandensis TaxID=3095367 RepID=UPI003557DC57